MDAFDELALTGGRGEPDLVEPSFVVVSNVAEDAREPPVEGWLEQPPSKAAEDERDESLAEPGLFLAVECGVASERQVGKVGLVISWFLCTHLIRMS